MCVWKVNVVLLLLLVVPQIPEFIQQLLMLLDDSDVPDHVTTVTDILKGVGLTPIGEVSPEQDDKTGEILKQFNLEWNGDTVLHIASAKGRPSLIPILLLYGADPTTKNHAGHAPYLVAANKEVRDSFRRFMAAYPEGYDYVRAHVPSPLTEDMERGRARKEAEKRKEKKKSRRLRDKVCNTVVMVTMLLWQPGLPRRGKQRHVSSKQRWPSLTERREQWQLRGEWLNKCHTLLF